MNNMIRIFENEKFGKVRTVIVNGEPWFAAKDVAEILGYTETAKAVRTHVDEDDKGVSRMDTPGGKQNVTVINESGLYSLILSSKMPRAKEFKRWVTAEILPTLRRTGGYVGNVNMFVDNYLSFCEESVKELFKLQFRCIDQLNERIRHDKPLVEFADQVSNTDNLIDMNAMAKLARAERIPIGRNRLYAVLRGMGILMTDNLPYQKYIDRGYFKVKESVFKTSAMTKTYRQTYVTGKGQLFVISLLKKYYGKEILQ